MPVGQASRYGQSKLAEYGYRETHLPYGRMGGNCRHGLTGTRSREVQVPQWLTGSPVFDVKSPVANPHQRARCEHQCPDDPVGWMVLAEQFRCLLFAGASCDHRDTHVECTEVGVEWGGAPFLWMVAMTWCSWARMRSVTPPASPDCREAKSRHGRAFTGGDP